MRNRNTKHKINDSKESLLEKIYQTVTRFVGGHWGTLFSLLLFFISMSVLIWDSQSETADIMEKFFTMLSLVLLFLLQRSQNKDTLSLQIKLNELLASHQDADSKLIDAEKRSEEELETLRDKFAADNIAGQRSQNR